MNQLSASILAMWSPGPIEIVIIGVIALLIFGKRLPEVARGLGQSFNQFKKGLTEVQESKEDVVSEVKNAVSVNNSIAEDN